VSIDATAPLAFVVDEFSRNAEDVDQRARQFHDYEERSTKQNDGQSVEFDRNYLVKSIN
jgi:hypothetical protein